LSGIEQLLQQLVKNREDTCSNHESRKGKNKGNKIARVGARETVVCPIDESSPHFEGESSLSAHSKQARQALESLLGRNHKVRNDPDVAAALSALQGMMQKKGSTQFASNLSASHTRFGSGANDGPMPPLSVAVDLISQVKGNLSLAWTWFG